MGGGWGLGSCGQTRVQGGRSHTTYVIKSSLPYTSFPSPSHHPYTLFFSTSFHCSQPGVSQFPVAVIIQHPSPAQNRLIGSKHEIPHPLKKIIMPFYHYLFNTNWIRHYLAHHITCKHTYIASSNTLLNLSVTPVRFPSAVRFFFYVTIINSYDAI